MKKSFLLVILLLLCSLSIALAAESTTYQPQWKLGDSITYENHLAFEIESSALPLQFKDMPNGCFEMSFLSRYKVLSQTATGTELQYSLDQIDLKFHLFDKVQPNWRQQLTEKDQQFFKLLELLQNKPLINFIVNSKGEIIQYTKLDQTAEFYHQVFTFMKENDPTFSETIGNKFPQSVEEWIPWLDKQLNHSNFAPLPQETFFWLYSSLHTGKIYPLNKQQPAKLSFPIPKISDFLENPTHVFDLTTPQENLDFDLKGISFAKKEDTSSTIETIYPFKDDDFYRFFSTLVEAFLSEKKGKEKSEALDSIQEMKSKKAFILNGTIVERFTFKEGQAFENGSLVFFLDGKIYPNRMRKSLPASADKNQEIPFKIKITYTAKRGTGSN